MFDDELLQSFINSFYGYGNYGADYWFVGMEERGGKDIDDISARLNAWHERGRNELEDVVDYHRAIGITKHFDERVVLQPTWNKIIRVLLSIDGHKPTTDQVREFQKNQLARSVGNSCLVELLPLPSPEVDKWLDYAQNSRLAFLKSREEYCRQVTPRRIEHLKNRINKHQPKVVIFYSFGYQDSWSKIAGIDFRLIESNEVKLDDHSQTLFVVVKHPATKGVTNEYFHNVGELIRENLAKKWR